MWLRTTLKSQLTNGSDRALVARLVSAHELRRELVVGRGLLQRREYRR